MPEVCDQRPMPAIRKWEPENRQAQTSRSDTSHLRIRKALIPKAGIGQTPAFVFPFKEKNEGSLIYI